MQTRVQVRVRQMVRRRKQRIEMRPGQPLSSLPCEAQELKDAGKSGLHQVKEREGEVRVNEFIRQTNTYLDSTVNNAGHAHRASQTDVLAPSDTWRNDCQGSCLELNHTLPCPSCHRPGIVLHAKEETDMPWGKMRQDGVQKCRQGGIWHT